MKFKLLIKILICFLFFPIVHATENECEQFEKLSAKYIECNAKKLKDNTNKKVKISKEKFEKSGIKDKLKKFKESKTLSDLIKD